MSRGMATASILIVMLFATACTKEAQESPQENAPSGSRITFVELGSVNCIPCRQMQPVMASIEKRYAGQVEVIFYDVWEEDQKQYARDYRIKLIPTQVFLDSSGTEIMRHEGFFPEAEIDSFLASQGLVASGFAE